MECFSESIAARYWRLELTGAKVDQKEVPQLNSTGVILDSGASLIFASSQDADTINQVPIPIKGTCVLSACGNK